MPPPCILLDVIIIGSETQKSTRNSRKAHVLTPEDPLLSKLLLSCPLLHPTLAFISPAWFFFSVPLFPHAQTIPKRQQAGMNHCYIG